MLPDSCIYFTTSIQCLFIVFYKFQNDSLSMESGNSCALLFEKLPNMEYAQAQWTDTEIGDATSLIHRNLQRLDSYLSFMVSFFPLFFTSSYCGSASWKQISNLCM